MVQDNDDLALYQLYNIGNSKPVMLLDFITDIENATDKMAIKEMLPMQLGDVEKTWADVKSLENDYEYKPDTDINEGMKKFVEWYLDCYNL